MKPIFKEEHRFLEEKLGISLPFDCWRDGKTILLNADKETAFLKFTVKGDELIIKSNKMCEVLSKNRNKTFLEEVAENYERLKELEKESIEKTKEYIEMYTGHELRVSHSAGKDSDVMYYILKKVFKEMEIVDYTIDFFNTTNDTAQTYLHIKKIIADKVKDTNYLINKAPLVIQEIVGAEYKKSMHNPAKGWYRWLQEDKNYFIPSVMVRNCCSTYKEGQVKKVLNKKNKYIIFLGARKYESTKRANYDWDLNEAIIKEGKKKLHIPENWRRFLPIVNWTDKDVWLYIIQQGIVVNKQYEYGYNRCG